jgi:hypothetical protein
MKDSKSKVLHDPIAYDKRMSDIEFAAPRKPAVLCPLGTAMELDSATPSGSLKLKGY